MAQHELRLPLVVDAYTEDIARKEVACKLHTTQLAANRLGERARQGGLADSWDVLDEKVAAREERDERKFHGLLLAFERPLDGLPQRLERRELLSDARGGARGGSRHVAQSSTPAPQRRATRRVPSTKTEFAAIRALGEHGAMTVVELRNVTKAYGPVRALVGVSCVFSAGTVAVIRGPNGSGKSTLLAIVGTLTRPTSGTVDHGVLGHRRAAIRRTLGWAGHESLCYLDLSGRENIELAARLYGCDPVDACRRATERFDLGPFVERPVRTYSRGQRQRIALARALVHEPRLLLLDEPTAGLDKSSTDRLMDVVREEVAHGAVVVVVTHDDAFAEAVGGQVVSLERGRKVSA